MDNQLELIDLREKFYKVSNNIYDYGLSVYELAVYGLLCRYANNETKESFPSLRHMCKKLNISKQKLIDSVKSLEEKKMIYKIKGDFTKSNRYALLNLNKFVVYQKDQIEEQVVHEIDQGGPHDRPGVVHEVDPIKTNIKKTKYKKTKEELPPKKPFMECLMFTEDQMVELVSTYGEKTIYEYMTKLNDYIMSTGKGYKSHYHVMLTWIRRDLNQSPRGPFK